MRQMQERQAAAQGAADAAAAAASGADPEAPSPLLDGFDENNPDTWGNPGRNDACPCGSGKKFKHCHGRL